MVRAKIFVWKKSKNAIELCRGREGCINSERVTPQSDFRVDLVTSHGLLLSSAI